MKIGEKIAVFYAKNIVGLSFKKTTSEPYYIHFLNIEGSNIKTLNLYWTITYKVDDSSIKTIRKAVRLNYDYPNIAKFFEEYTQTLIKAVVTHNVKNGISIEDVYEVIKTTNNFLTENLPKTFGYVAEFDITELEEQTHKIS